ncbi:MAG: sugar ABC transporter ATP-binding protein [Caldilineaceae bacterium]|nr:sugar ABC transporter ATP-binding protein [Caldilineaceae bacterium]
MQQISKRFDVTQALDDVSLTLYPGEIHALLGENGAGKSTLIKIMTGIHRPDRGQLLLDGKPVSVHNSVDAQKQGIAAIHQEPMIFPDLNVAENIFISHAQRGLFLHWGRMYEEAEQILAQLDIKLDVRSQASGLTLAQQQAVEIAKAISLKVRVLIMDEPTASLSAHEVDQLFKLARRLRAQGVALLFISHRMEEVFAIADRITVMRDGKLISTGPAREYTAERAIRDMVGRKVEDFFAHRAHEQGDLLMSVRGLGRSRAFHDISFDVHRGEVLGLAGLVGARRTDIGLALFGIEPADSGEVIFEGQRVEIRSPQQAVALQIAYATEDRRQLGLTLPMSITTNITLPMLRHYLAALGLVRRKEENATGESYRRQLAIRAPSVQQIVGKLSGGNQQKVMLAKWLNTHPKLLILDEPTRGIDVGTKAEVHRIIGDLAAEGMAIILISSDLPEVLAMSDRILVMREGHQMAIFDRAEATQERILAAAMGQAQPVTALETEPEAQGGA